MGALEATLDVVLSKSETVQRLDKLFYFLFIGIEISSGETELLVQIYAHVGM